MRKRKLLVTDWNAWADFTKNEEKEAIYQDPIGRMKTMVAEKLKLKKYSPKSWWDAEIKEQRKVAR